jgi:hypothetical protein
MEESPVSNAKIAQLKYIYSGCGGREKKSASYEN